MDVGTPWGKRLGARSISMELPTLSSASSRGVTWKDTRADVSQDIGGSKARGGVYAARQALALESELNKVVQHLRRPSGNLPPEVADRQVPPWLGFRV